VVYRVAYAVVTVGDDDPVTNDNSAFAIANCNACTTVAVSFQVVLVVGESHVIAPIDAAGAVNYNCPACVTTAIATQLVVTLKEEPPESLTARLSAALSRLNVLSTLGSSATPEQIAAQVESVQEDVENLLRDSGLLTDPLPDDTPTATPTATTSTSPSVPAQRTSPEPSATSPIRSDSPSESDPPSPSQTPTSSPSASQPSSASPTASATTSSS
jgi:putative peptide zinc metalloprotease protein